MRLIRLAVCALAATVLSVLLWVSPAQGGYANSPKGNWVPNGTVFAIARHGDRVYLAGGFTALKNLSTGRSVQRARLAALDANTGELITSFNPAADARVHALAISPDGSTLYAGGDFTAVNGAANTRLAALDATGALMPGWQASASASVRDLVLADGGLYVGGKFGNVNGRGRRGLARLDAATGALTRSWVAHVDDGKVHSLALSGDGTELIAGGTFLALDGVARELLGAVSLGSGDVTGWAPTAVCLSCTVFDLDVEGGVIYGAVGGGGGGRAAAWNPATGARLWVRRGDGDAQAIAVHDGVAYVGGHFGPVFDNQPRRQLVALVASTGVLLPFQVPFTGLDKPGIWALSADAEALRVGGGFQGIEGTNFRKYAEFATSDVTAPEG